MMKSRLSALVCVPLVLLSLSVGIAAAQSRPTAPGAAGSRTSGAAPSVLAGVGQNAGPAPSRLYGDVTPVCSIESLTKVKIPDTTIESAVAEPDGSCLVTAIVTHPPAHDHVRVFIALPTKGWNGRFYGTGGAVFAGGFQFALIGPVHQGYAAGATDTGHSGFSGNFGLDANGRLDWQSIEDKAYFGIHDMTVVGKALVSAFYGKAPRYSYFVGFSTGGRQGLMEAQRYSEDYDGIISGCPAINWTKFVLAELWPKVVMMAAHDTVSAAKLRAATAAAIAASEASGNTTDGVILDPSRCTYDPKALVGTRVADSTFTESDADVVRKIWEGPRAPDGQFLWYGLSRGADLTLLSGPMPFPVPMDWIRYFLTENPKWDISSLTPAEFDRLFRQSVEEYAAIFATDNPDLSRFRDHGGKIIITHGQADQLIMTAGTVEYYNHVLQKMGGPEKVMPFARLFLIPGAGHGPGGVSDGDRTILRWVEQGTPPSQLVVQRRTPNGPVTRLVFAFPAVAKYKGAGNVEDAANYSP